MLTRRYSIWTGLFLAALGAASLVVACDLNPQPLPPGESSSVGDGGTASPVAGNTSEDAGPAQFGAGGEDAGDAQAENGAGPRDGGDAGDAGQSDGGDAGETDGGDAATSDAGEDAQ